ncbi:MAG: nucleoside hydrolase [Limnospira sp.]
MSKPPVILDHDGAVDDFLSTVLLMTMDGVQPLGVVVTPADCYIGPAVSATRKILDLMGKTDVTVAESTVRGVNPFPGRFRRDCFVVDHLPILNERDAIATPLAPEPGQEFLAEAIRNAAEPVTLMVTGPLTTVAEALKIAPDIESNIEKIVWMGGALNVPGNVGKDMEPGQDGSAEWNAYWDPFAIAQIWETQIPVVLCALDITNTVPLTSDLIRQLGRQRRYPLSDLAGQCYAIAISQDYYFWDVLATAYLADPERYELQALETGVITRGESQGRIVLKPGGRRIQMMRRVDLDWFYSYILEQWRR